MTPPMIAPLLVVLCEALVLFVVEPVAVLTPVEVKVTGTVTIEPSDEVTREEVNVTTEEVRKVVSDACCEVAVVAAPAPVEEGLFPSAQDWPYRVSTDSDVEAS